LKRALLLLFAIALAGGLLGCGGGGDDSSGSTSTATLSSCDINGKQQDLGASYVTTIDVEKVSCSHAEKVVMAYHQCRAENGGAGGTCDAPVQGFTCTEGPRQEVPGVQFNATADCRKGDAEIKSSYTQNF
jgi:hypothetical protein